MFPWNAEDLTLDLSHFNGKVRLFPLPDLVMFPHVMQPLHIHEPRYLDMLNEALDSDGLLAMSVLKPGWDNDYDGRPPINAFACLGKIVTHQRQDDGQYNVLLLGMRRVKIERELPPKKSFREAQVTLLDDFCLTDNDQDRDDLQTALTTRFQECLPSSESATPALGQLLATEVPLSVLTDLVSFALPLDYSTKCELLGESDVDRRAWLLLDAMDRLPDHGAESRLKPRRGYLPPFSAN